ncbi:riboflavin synthase [Sphingomonas sp. Leaf242]|uniref:riboflavin synthase n=1 Tax=Sphingomonas sp. Leaf242 TaxID=1736304 RepID=UPI00071340E9|nr:riboflavin synthase [Sphingomonas sp. Leaf242]KQO08146.1 riboflavin synthase subunit alpha [Sphingomonas sp. Leaf242]
MFTGIITDIGTVARVESPGDTRIVVRTAYDTETVDLGASISCSGVCLTVVDKGPNWFAVDVSGETISRTAKDQWTEGRQFNLERAMKLGDELGGHIVTGHVDGLGTVVAVSEDGGSHRVTIRAGADIAPFIAPKGSVTVDGVSLTVNSVRDIDGVDGQREVEFGLNIIPHTWSVTTLGTIHVEQSVNIEIDVLARYLQRMEHYRAAAR